jgi:hypothetical protein
MLNRIVLAAVFAVIAFLVCVFAGGLLVTTGVPLAVFVGGFLKEWATVISILVFLYYFFVGGGLNFPSFRKPGV